MEWKQELEQLRARLKQLEPLEREERWRQHEEQRMKWLLKAAEERQTRLLAERQKRLAAEQKGRLAAQRAWQQNRRAELKREEAEERAWLWHYRNMRTRWHQLEAKEHDPETAWYGMFTVAALCRPHGACTDTEDDDPVLPAAQHISVWLRRKLDRNMIGTWAS